MQTPTFLNTLEFQGLQLSTLVRELEENFPPTNPHPDDSHASIMYSSGQRSVVEWITYRLSEDYNGKETGT
jgi:hypothetical protein